MSWSSEIPAELLCRPQGLVVLTGLDVVYNAIHKAIWDCFCNNRRPDRVPLLFKVLSADHEYPKARPKRTSYEWYIPKGILKTTWLGKHLDQIPAVVVIFFDLDWDEAMWKERQMECATKIEIIRSSLSGRNTRVAVVLIQKAVPLPPGEDVVAAERAASLCSACDLSAKSLFVLPHTDHLLGYTIRLENAFHELAQSYYHTEARKVKAHKEFLNKTTHQLLFVRHQFKIAFLNELKQDTHMALKHYKQAYAHILDLRMHESNLLEMKTIAGFINYKICRLCFQHTTPLDAISQFRKHIDFFKKKEGPKELGFEGSAWMSKQFQMFGDLFDEAIKLGLTAIQTQHPGFYFQQAAIHAITRKQLAAQLCKPGSTVSGSDPLEHLKNLDYYGQRPWRQGHQSIEPPDLQKEKDGIQALQALEHKVDHCMLTIPLLSNAVGQFKKYKSPRMKRYLMVQMGEEYYDAKEFNKALGLLCRVTMDYRNERWWPLLTSILQTSLRCAYLSANVQEYVMISLELAGKYTICSLAVRKQVQENLNRVIKNQIPNPEPETSTALKESTDALWEKEGKSPETTIFTIEMQNIIGFVECKACFTQDVFPADKRVYIHVFLKSHAPNPVGFSKLSVLLNNQLYNKFCIISDVTTIDDANQGADQSKSLLLEPNQVKVFTFSFLPLAEDVGKMLEITSIALKMGLESERCAILHWPGGGGDAVVPSYAQQPNVMQMSTKPDTAWEYILVKPVTKLLPRSACMTLSLLHEAPSIVNEFYVIRAVIKSDETSTITDVKYSFGLQMHQDPHIEKNTHVSIGTPNFDGTITPRVEDITLVDLEAGQEVEKTLFVKSLETGDKQIFCKISYKIAIEMEGETIHCVCHKEENLLLSVVDPFNMSIKLESMQYEVVETVHADEPFMLVTELYCASPWPIQILSSELKLNPAIKFADEEPSNSQLESLVLKSADSAGECHCLVAPPAIEPNVNMGEYNIHWKRLSSGENVPYVYSSFTLPKTTVEQIPIFVKMDIPEVGHLRSCLNITYKVHNRTPYSQEVEATMEASDAFMFSGHKQHKFRVMPNDCFNLTYSMYPLLPGNVLLPKLHLDMLRYPGTMDAVVQKMLQNRVYIQPSGKKDGFIDKL